MLPPLAHPYILDLGCGQGGPTRELARLSQGPVVGLDLQLSELVKFRKMVTGTDPADQVLAVAASMHMLPFLPETFDILWAEGSIHIVGLERGLQRWRPYLIPAGFMVIHEMCWLRPDPPPAIRDHWRMTFPGIGTAADYQARIPGQGYRLLEHFCLPEELWWNEYYGPLAERIQNLRERYAGNLAALKILDREQQDVDLYRQHQAWYGSVFLIMQRDGP